jgi:hypothetical protein
MLYLLFTLSYLIDVVILIFFIVLILSLSRSIKSLGVNYSLIDKLKIAPHLVLLNSATTFKEYAQKNNDGTYQISFHQHKDLNYLLKKAIHSALGFIFIKIIIVSLILINIPRPSEAQPKQNQYQAKDYTSFSQGSFNQTVWEEDGITLKAGQLSGNYTSPVIGDGQSLNNWQTLAWQADRKYNQKPEYPKETIAVWNLDTLDNCAATSNTYKCQSSKIESIRGIYNSSAYNFDGFNSKTKISKDLNFNGSFTIGAWIKPSVNIINGSEEQNFVILAKGYGDYADKKPYAFRYNFFFGFKNGSLSLIFWPDSDQEHWVMGQNTKYMFEPSRWYHVAGVFDDKQKVMKIYIDGIEQTNLSADYDEGKINYSPNTKRDNFPSWIGGVGYRWQDKEEKIINVFKGALDEVFIANTAMNVLDIRNLVNQAGEIYFQVRTGENLPLMGAFWGPEGKATNYFTQPEANKLDFLSQSKYLQYIAFIARPNTNFSPKLSYVSLDYLTPIQNEDYRITITSDKIISQVPAQKDIAKEKLAINVFVKYFQNIPQDSADWEFVHLVAYNKVNKRNLDKEIPSVIAFIKNLKRIPKNDLDWGLVKALAYSVKGGDLLKIWQKK